MQLECVGAGVDGALCGEQSDVVGVCERAYGLDGGAYDSEHAACGVECGEVALLYGAQCFGRCGVAGEYDELAALLEECLYGLQCVSVDDVEGV